jgi:tryptophanyl-tRNA synthetase
VVFAYLDAFDPEPDVVAALKAHYQRGGLGDVPLKRRLTDVLEALIAPIRAKRAELAADPAFVQEVLRAGTCRAAETTRSVLSDVRRAFSLG